MAQEELDKEAQEAHQSNLEKIQEQARITALVEEKKRKENEFRVQLLEANLL